jgi:hypothetical protein
MDKIELPEKFKKMGLYEVVVIEDKKGIFIKCSRKRQKGFTYISVKSVNDKYFYEMLVEEKEIEYLNNKYGTGHYSNIVY